MAETVWPWPPVGPVLIVSPHYDDAVLSCWALLSSGANRDICTAFGGVPPGEASAWDRQCGFATGAEAAIERMREDACALDLLNVGYFSITTRQKSESIVQAIAGWIDAHIGASDPLTVAVPAGAGVSLGGSRATTTRAVRDRSDLSRNGTLLQPLRSLKHAIYTRRRARSLRQGSPAHPDHLLVREAGFAAVSGRHSVDLVLDEDLPYLWSYPADDMVAAVSTQRRIETVPIVAEIDRDRKHQALACYASKLPHLDHDGRLLHASTLPPQERYWCIIPGGGE